MKNLFKHIVLISLTFILIACGAGEMNTPEHIIPEDAMVEIITEIELTQALLKLKIANQDTVSQKQLFDETYKQFDISEEEFNSSLAYYCQDPKLLEGIYVKVINSISKKQAELQK